MRKQLLNGLLAFALTACVAAAPTTPAGPPSAPSIQTSTPQATATPPFAPAPAPTLPPTSTEPSSNPNQFARLVTQLGGSLNSLALYKTWVFVGQGPRLIALDLNDLTQIQVKAQSQVLPGLVENVIIQDQTVYLTAGKNLILLDLTDLTDLKIKGQLELPGEGNLILRGNIIYVAGHSSQNTTQGYLATVDVSANPKLLSVVEVPYRIASLALRQNLLYLAREQTGDLLTVDVSQPAQLAQPVPVLTTAPAIKLRIFGDRLVVAGYSNVEAYNLSDATHPTLQWQVQENKLGQVSDFMIQGHQLLTFGLFPSEVYIPARAVSNLPEQNLGEADYVSPASAVSDTSGDILVLEDGALNILFWVKDQDFQTLASYAVTGGALGVDQDQLLVSEADRLTSYRLPNLAQVQQAFPVLATSFSSLASTLTMADGYVYVSGADGLHILNAHDLSPVGEIHATQDFSLSPNQNWFSISIPVANKVAYLHGSTSTGQDEIIPFDVSDPAHPRQIGTLPFENGLHIVDIAASNKWLAVSLASSTVGEPGWLALYDLSSGTPESAGKIQLTHPASEIQISHDLLLAGEGELEQSGTLHVYALPSLSPLGVLPLPEIVAIGLSDSVAYVTTRRTGQVFAVDFSQPKAPTVIGSLQVATGAGNLAVAGDSIVIGNRIMGLYVFQP